MAVLDCYHRELSLIKWLPGQQVKQHRPVSYHLLQTIPGVGRIPAFTILYEERDIRRFDDPSGWRAPIP